MDRPARQLICKIATNNCEIVCGNCYVIVGNAKILLQNYLKIYPIITPVVELFMEIGHLFTCMRVETTDVIDIYPEVQAQQSLNQQEKQFVISLISELNKKYPARYTMYYPDGTIVIGILSVKRVRDAEITSYEKQYRLLDVEKEHNPEMKAITESMEGLRIKMDNVPMKSVRLNYEDQIKANYKSAIERQNMLNDAYRLMAAGLDPGINMTKEQIETALSELYIEIETITSEYPNIGKPEKTPVIPPLKLWGTGIYCLANGVITTADKLCQQPGFSWVKQLINYAEKNSLTEIDLNANIGVIKIRINDQTIHERKSIREVELFASWLVPVVQSMLAHSVYGDLRFSGYQQTLAQTGMEVQLCCIYEVKTYQARREIEVMNLQTKQLVKRLI
jgi:hypothetical protein